MITPVNGASQTGCLMRGGAVMVGEDMVGMFDPRKKGKGHSPQGSDRGAEL